MPRRLSALALALGLFLAGCGGTSASDVATSAGSVAAGAATPTATGTSTDAAGTTAGADCPAENTRSFAKTRFAADVGGSVFLFNRYIYQPYKNGTFTKGASGRRTALVKAGLAGAATVKLLKNASENAKANPTLCRTVAAPLAQVTDRLGSIATGLATGAVTGSSLDGISGLLGAVTGGASRSGIPVQEQNPGLPGLG